MLNGFVEVAAGKHLHYVRHGEGPALIMLHASPCSAKVMAPLQDIFAPRWTTFAFDLPGFGFSDALDDTPLETAHLADAIAAGVRALGLEQVAAYGRHTGAGVAVEIALRHPDLISMVLTDGFPVFGQPYSDERLAEYLPPIVPRWDGSHLIWAWFRYREQHVFWPWDKALPNYRADTEVPPLDFLYRGAVELLDAGADYPVIYASAFRHPGLAMIDQVRPPVCYGNRPGDSQHKTMKLYPASAWVQEFPRDALEAAAQEQRVLAMHPPRGTVPPHRTRVRLGMSSVMDYVATPQGSCFVRGVGLDRTGTPLVLLPDLPGSVMLHDDIVQSLGRHRPVLAIDPCGIGRSVFSPERSVGIELWANDVEAVLDELGLDRVAILAVGTSAGVALEVARRGRVTAAVLQSPPVGTPPAWAEIYAPDVTPRADGGNFLALWHHLRNQELWFPWFEQNPAHARTSFRIDPDKLHERAVVMLAQPTHYRPTWRAILSHALDEQLARASVPVMIAYRADDIFAGSRDRAATLAGAGPAVLLPDEAGKRLDAWFSSAADAASAHRDAPTRVEGQAHAAT